MKSRSGTIAIGVIGLIIILFTIAVFFLLEIERNVLNYWALAFLLLSEIALFGGLIWLRFAGVSHNKTFLRLGITSVLFLYFAATLILSIFAGGFGDRLNLFILLQLAIIVFASIITILVLAFSKSTQRRNEEDMKKVGVSEPKRGGF